MDPHYQKVLIDEIALDYSKIVQSETRANIISKDWWRDWCSFVGYKCPGVGEQPGAISNEALLSEHLSELEENSVLVTKEMWRFLQDWYDGGPELTIFITKGVPDWHPTYLYASSIENTFISDSQVWKMFWVSLKIPVSELKSYLCEQFSLDSESTKLNIVTQIDSGTGLKALDSSYNRALEEVGVKTATKISLEKKKARPVIKFDFLSDNDDDTLTEVNLHENLNTIREGEGSDFFTANENESDKLSEGVRSNTELLRLAISERTESHKIKLKIKDWGSTIRFLNESLASFVRHQRKT